MAISFGSFRIDVVAEQVDVPLAFTEFLPTSHQAAIQAEADWLLPRFANPELTHGLLSFHSYLLRSPTHTVLIDSCMGNDKDRGGHALFHKLQTPWLARLAALGVEPAEVDYVLCTHLHGDHVGWNTTLRDGRWIPTFHRARYVFSRVEYEHRRAAFELNTSAGLGVFADSILPVMQSGQALLVESDHELAGLLRLESAAGHTPGNVIIQLDTAIQRGEPAVIFSGDVVHHPLQVVYPEWSSAFCEDPLLSAGYRRAFVERHADQDHWILPAHFAQPDLPHPTPGRIISAGGRWHWQTPSESLA
jgi:glyoxylase-like metal-dependent hydrolase (beta-lactamase superfamily II)